MGRVTQIQKILISYLLEDKSYEVQVDRSIVRTHSKCSWSTKIYGVQAVQAPGHSCSELSAQIMTTNINENISVVIQLTSGAANDCKGFELVLEEAPIYLLVTHMMMDKGFDSDKIWENLKMRKIKSVIPEKN